MGGGTPPIWILILVQAASVIGDSFGQRVSRIHHKGSRRHMMIGLCVVSSIQMLVILGILQLSLPTRITGAVYVNGKEIACTKQECSIVNGTEVCHNEKQHCSSQGPGSMFQQIYHHPLLLVNGAVNILYYTGETMLYREPLGLIFLVVASLASTFLINPINFILRQPVDKPLPAVVLILGIIGALLCVIERKPKDVQHDENEINKDQQDDETKSLLGSSANYMDSTNINTTEIEVVKSETITQRERVLTILKASLRVFFPFMLLSVTYALWFVIQKYVNDDFHVNAFGYNSLDQGLLPIYLFIWLLIVDFIKPLKSMYEDNDNINETLFQAIVNTFKEGSIRDLFFYRLFINGRAFAYFLLAVNYNLTVVYLELTLIRVIVSWVGAIALCLLIPKFIGTTAEEKRTVFSPINLGLKFLGTASVTVSLILLNVVYNKH